MTAIQKDIQAAEVRCSECGQGCYQQFDEYAELWCWFCPSHGYEKISWKRLPATCDEIK